MKKNKKSNSWTFHSSKTIEMKIRIALFLLLLIFSQANGVEASPITAQLENNDIALKGNFHSMQQLTITGTVVDKEELPLPGVNIIVKGTGIGTITDLEGKYSIEVPSSNSILTFSFLGYLTEEIDVFGKTVIDITLIEDIMELDEVVITALGIKREQKALGYSVQAVAGENLETVKGVDITTSLTGKVAGLQIRNTTEFAAEDSINLRGSKPILVIDGVPYANMSLRDIPPDDIANISVLKGATASALYGYRGGGGAIMVTTKKGSGDKGATISVNTGSMFTAGFLAIPEQQSKYGRDVSLVTEGEFAGEYFYSRDGEKGSWGIPMDGRSIVQWDPISKSLQLMEYLPRGKNNFRNYMDQGYILNNNISLMQHWEMGSFRSSASWVRNKGIYPNSTFDKITYSMGGDITINDFTLSSSMSYNKNKSPNTGFNGYTAYDPMYSLLIWSSPDFDVTQYKDYWLVENEEQNNSYSTALNNPYFDRYERIHNLNKDVFNGSLALDYDVTSWLNTTARIGFDMYSNKQEVVVATGTLRNAGATQVLKGGKYIWGSSSTDGSYNIGIGRGYSINNDFLLNAEQTFDKFRMEGLLGGSVFFKQDEGMEALTRGGLSIPGYYSLNASVGELYVNSRVSKEQVNSLYGRLALSWESLIFVEGTIRNDWASVLYSIASTEESHSYFYPSVSTSFVVSELLPEMDWLSLWKIRSSWTDSKDPGSPYNVNPSFTVQTDGWSMSYAELPTSIRGAVEPEGSSTIEIGTNINFYKNRASFDVAYFNKRRYDIIKNASVSGASGFSAVYTNTDEEITTKGVEVTTNITPVKISDLKWDVSLNWSKYLRYYTQLDDELSQDKPWVKEGERVDHFLLQDFQRDADGNIIHSAGLPLTSPYYLFYDYYDPNWMWGITSSVRYKDFSFSISADGRVGGLISSMTESYMWLSGNHPDSDTEERYLDVTQSEEGGHYLGEGVKIVSGTVTYDSYGYVATDTREFAPNDVEVLYENYVKALHNNYAWGRAVSPLDAYDGTFFKIREVSITYTLPKEFCARFAAKSASISAVSQNVFLWAKQFKYSDPDGGRENFADPSVRYIGMNLRVTF